MGIGMGMGIARRYLADWSAKMKTFLAGDDGVLGSADDRRCSLVAATCNAGHASMAHPAAPRTACSVPALRCCATRRLP
jgi:hypothetical protein